MSLPFRAISISIVVVSGILLALHATSDSNLKPFPAPAEDVATDYFGMKVADPYRWMEGGAENARLTDFLKAQNTYTRSVLDAIKGRDLLLARIQELKRFYELDLDSGASHRLKEIKSHSSRKPSAR